MTKNGQTGMSGFLKQFMVVAVIQTLIVIEITWRVIMRRPPEAVAFNRHLFGSAE